MKRPASVRIAVAPQRPVVPEPGDHIVGGPIRCEHWIEHMLDGAVFDDQGQALDQPHAFDGHGREAQGRGKLELGIAQDREREA
jgi:hypothetical protein